MKLIIRNNNIFKNKLMHTECFVIKRDRDSRPHKLRILWITGYRHNVMQAIVCMRFLRSRLAAASHTTTNKKNTLKVKPVNYGMMSHRVHLTVRPIPLKVYYCKLVFAD